ncbi:ABC transporter ATP-binding protein [Ornithinimicrobium cerasi]|uniref:ABC-2 type transport system ATP-binding protein n=1 Tax=Ornithinimicrobium cerasi TaxID=2248773 RepID=A0A285VFT3_9MICO|nr:ABC transporter ATP-binding protein [Ornithinimicrobium cerasi]SOC52817.1 ABC-2 type transport system ATP-binding protein [Ornithinimicrobium cerasi]
MTVAEIQGSGISVRGLTKSFGSFRAVDDLTFEVRPGRVTGFLGPNGAGKTTTLRMLLGLIRPSAGEALIGGRRYADLSSPMQVVGAALEATGFHPGRSGRDHLRVLAATHGIPDARVDQLLELVGIPAAARKRAGDYSMGMRQRLGLAGALLGDPDVLLLDEPANGLDPEGIRWMRGFMQHLARDQGKTVLVSSHMLSEVEQTVEDVVIIANGHLVREGTMEELHGEPSALVRTTDPAALAAALERAGIGSAVEDGGAALRATTGDLARVGDVALAAGLPVHELRPLRTDLERLFLQLTEAPEHRNRNLAGGELVSGDPDGAAPPVRAVGDGPPVGQPAGGVPARSGARHTDVPAPAEETR